MTDRQAQSKLTINETRWEGLTLIWIKHRIIDNEQSHMKDLFFSEKEDSTALEVLNIHCTHLTFHSSINYKGFMK